MRPRSRSFVVRRRDRMATSLHFPIAAMTEPTEPTEPEILRAAMRRLSAETGALLEAYYFEQATLEELGRRTQLPENTVRARLSRGRAALHALLEQDPRWAALAAAAKSTPRSVPRDAVGALELLRRRRQGTGGG
jgi:RNA polymerase sigma-70 factor, ECF subfamily